MSKFPKPLSLEERRSYWHQIWSSLGLEAPDALFLRLEKAYGEPQRKYHNTDHLGEVLALLQKWPGVANPAELALALWFHDAVYDPMANDNEEESAELARTELVSAGLSVGVAGHIAELVMVTKHLGARTVGLTTEVGIILDIDLAILGSGVERYRRYSQAVREEYSHVSQADYKVGRQKVIAFLFPEPHLFNTSYGREFFEPQAKINMYAEYMGMLSPLERRISRGRTFEQAQRDRSVGIIHRLNCQEASKSIVEMAEQLVGFPVMVESDGVEVPVNDALSDKFMGRGLAFASIDMKQGQMHDFVYLGDSVDLEATLVRLSGPERREVYFGYLGFEAFETSSCLKYFGVQPVGSES